MIMKNDKFDFLRFGKYFASDIRTCWANYGLSLMTIAILVPVVLYVVTAALNMLSSYSWDGPDSGLRLITCCFAIICMIVTMPVKCYGKVTEKKFGSFWLTLPASRLEKFISMILMTCIIVPALGIGLYLGIDAFICAIDNSCGDSLLAHSIGFLRNINDIQELSLNFINGTVEIENAAVAHKIISQLDSPLLYIDEIFGISLPFLLGAIYFKKGKTVKTILVMFAASIAISIAVTPVMESWTNGIFEGLKEDSSQIISMFDNGFFKNIVLIDTISDTVTNVALLTCIWLRIKTLKH